jgi:exosortase E/protease (VPEID-CTERM system)
LTIDLDQPSNAEVARPLPFARWAGLVALLLAEMLGLSIRFNDIAGPHSGRGWWWAELLGKSHFLFFVMIPAVSVAVLIGGANRGDRWQRLSRQIQQPRRSWPFLLGHLAAFLGFARLTASIWDGGIQSSPHPEGWVVAWALMGLATAVFWIAMALPIGLWVPLARRGWGALAAGVVIGIAAYQAGLNTRLLWRPLHQLTFWAVDGLLGLISRDVICRPAEFAMGIPPFVVTVEPICSGYEGIGLIWIFLGAYLWFFRRELRFPRALLLLPLGTVLIWLTNVLRITLLIIIGAWGSPDVAIGGFHSKAGWLAFNGVGLGLIAASRRFRTFRADDPLHEHKSAKGPNPTAAHLAPLLAIIATTMLTGAFSSGFDSLYPLRVLAAAIVLWHFRRDYAGWRWTWSWQPIAIGVGVFVLWMALEPIKPDSGGEDPLSTGLLSMPGGWASAWLSFRVIGSVVTVPLAEELAFRGYLTRRLIASDFQEIPLGRFSWTSFLVSSVLFGALHERWLAGTLAGMLYALALYRRGEITEAILAHSTTNALIAAYVLTTGTWSLWA